MATQLTLIIGAILLACGSGGLFIVRLTNPRFKGLGWLGGSFASGSFGALLLFDHHNTSAWLCVVLADVLILLAFVLLHVAFLELTESKSLVPVLGIILVALQIAADLWVIDFGGPDRFRTLAVGILVAAQTGQTAIVLLRESRHSIQVPGWFCATVLVGFMGFNLLRSFFIGIGVLNDPHQAYKVQIVTYILYIAVALGMAFGFFWMTATSLNTRLEQMASTDPLTRVYNRRVFLDWCEKELSRAQRANTSFSILMLDLDHFKTINDSFGHHAGDEMLCAVVEEIQDSVRGIDILGRWGGEEFTVLLPGASLGAAFVVAQRIRGNIEKISLQIDDREQKENTFDISVTASLGIASFRGDGDSIADLMQRADSALYQAKADGRNRVLTAS